MVLTGGPTFQVLTLAVLAALLHPGADGQCERGTDRAAREKYKDCNAYQDQPDSDDKDSMEWCEYEASHARAYMRASITLIVVASCLGGCICIPLGMCVANCTTDMEEPKTLLGAVFFFKGLNIATDWGWVKITLAMCDPDDDSGLRDTAIFFVYLGSGMLLFDLCGQSCRAKRMYDDEDHGPVLCCAVCSHADSHTDAARVLV